MTWNVQDAICSTANKLDGINDWTAIARIIASLKPDVLVLQETGDNSGNGTGSGVDSVATLTATINLLLHGGPGVTAWVQKYDPAYDLPYVFVSSETDGFNRNVVLSRYPFADLNGDGQATRSDIPTVLGDQYAPGGDGGIRGYMLAELNLPGATYRGDMVAGNGHLKSGSDASDLADRLLAAKNIAYVIDYWFNGAGTGIPDPNGRISDGNPPNLTILPEFTPFVWCGDWNEDEWTNGRDGPALWMIRAAAADPATDGTDRDRADSTHDDARNPFSPSNRRTHNSNKKLDYIAWQDSIATQRVAFVFDNVPIADWPPELVGFASSNPTFIASDHKPVVSDFIMALFGDFNGDGFVDFADYTDFDACYTGPGPAGLDPSCQPGDFDSDDDVDCDDWELFQVAWSAGGSPPGLGQCGGVGVGACCNAGVCVYPESEGDCLAGGGAYRGQGSDCTTAYCPVPGSVIISEIMYNPNSDETAPNDVEWVEIYNVSSESLSIEGWYLQDEDGFAGVLPAGVALDPGQAAVLIPSDQSVVDFQAAWGTGFDIYALSGWNAGGLSGLDNSPDATNEILELTDLDGQPIDEVNFDDDGDWPTDAPDGPSIYLLAGLLDAASNDLGTSWNRSQAGNDEAYANVVTGDFNGADVGSPGVVSTFIPECAGPGECDDGVACTDDSCVAQLCVHTPNHALCANEFYCDGAEQCDTLLGCQPGTDPCPGPPVCLEDTDQCVACLVSGSCDDGIFCTINECINNVCVYTPDNGVCDDGLFCNGAETCSGQFGCLLGSDPCGGAGCNEATDQCANCALPGDCDDNDECTQDDCDQGTCTFTPRPYGDVDGNGFVTLADLFCVLDGFGGTYDPPCTLANIDINPCGGGNGVIGLADLFAVLDAFGGDDPCCGG